MAKKVTNSLTLVCLDIEGQWNFPLLKNAAEINGASIIFATKKKLEINSTISRSSFGDEMDLASINDLRATFDFVLACETGQRAKSLFKFPRPHGKVAVLVGNEIAGIPKEDLKQADAVVSIPLVSSQMSSLNVATAAGITLFFLDKDLARRGTQKKTLNPENVDVFLNSPIDSNEIGSLLRSIWALGWRKLYLKDPHQVWFSNKRDVILAGRSAARREKNPIVVLPAEQLDYDNYEIIINCNSNGDGSPLSRFKMPKVRNALLTFGTGEFQEPSREIINLHVDVQNRSLIPCYRHAGSILCAYFSQYFPNRG